LANLGGRVQKGKTMQGKQDEERSGSRRQLQGLPMIRVHVAGIDLGSERHWVCAPTVDGNARDISDFGATTPELIRLAEWLKARHVESVALESTGVYWIVPHEILEAHGLEVLLVDTRQLARVPGRDKKTDPSGCEWIQRLHSCGSFRPPEAICMLRTLVRDKATLVAESGDWIRRMQKSLDQMNVRVHRAVSDIDGVTGMAILRAIAQGERDPRKLAQQRNSHCRKSQEEIAEQLSGHWREDHLFSLQQALKRYDAIAERITAYEQEIQRKLGEMEPEQRRGTTAPPLHNANKARGIKRRGQEAMRQCLYRMSGVDATQIDAIGVETMEVIVSEYGPDLSRFPSEKDFISHLTLAPHVPKSGGQPLHKKKRSGARTRVANVLRMAALSLRHSDTALGAYHRHLAQRLGGDVALFASARKLATIIYRLLRWGQPYIDEGVAQYEQRYEQQRLRSLGSRAKSLGYKLTPINA
jgi:transposase